jgi:quinol monooxygenase YgiN
MRKLIIPVMTAMLIIAAACTPKQPEVAAPPAVAPVADSLTSKMITAKVFVKSEKVANFIEAAKFIIDSSNAEPGCISYQLYQNPYDKTKFIFVEVWKDQMAIDNHFSMSYFKAFGPLTKDWLLQDSELKIYDVTLNP